MKNTQINEISEEITFKTWAVDLLPGMNIKTFDEKPCKVEYVQRIDSDFVFVKFEHREVSLQKSNERFTIIIDEEQLDKMRCDNGSLPEWCFDSCGYKRFPTIPNFKK